MINDFYLNRNKISFARTLSMKSTLHQLQGGEVFRASGHWGKIIVHQLKRIKYSICLTFFEPKSTHQIEIRPLNPGLTTTAAIKNNICQIICGVGKVHLNENQLVSAYGKGVCRIMQLKKLEATVTLDIQWSKELFEDIFPDGDPLRLLLKDFDNVYPTLIGEPYRIVDDRLKEIINQLIFTQYPDDLQDEMERSHVEDYLLHILNLSKENLSFNGSVDENDLNKVNNAIKFINENLLKHLTIAEIAEEVNLSASKLKICFKQVTGKCVFEYIMHQRFAKIKYELIHTDKPMKALFEDSGYRDVAAFSNGFKRQMGCCPAAFREGKL